MSHQPHIACYGMRRLLWRNVLCLQESVALLVTKVYEQARHSCTAVRQRVTLLRPQMQVCN